VVERSGDDQYWLCVVEGGGCYDQRERKRAVAQT
jgi:hypothetical protein